MNKHGKKLLSALLVIAMMASLLIVPAGAAEVTDTTTYDFQSDEFRACGITESAGAFTWTTDAGDVTGTNAFIQGNNSYGVLVNNGGTLVIPVTGNCDIKVAYKQRSNLKLGGQDAGKDLGSGTTATATVHYQDWQEGDSSVTLTSTGGQSYILSIAVAPLTTPPELALTAESVVVKLGDTATVTPMVSYATMEEVTVTSTDEGVATAQFADGAITITPVAAGKATVNVSVAISNAADGSTDPLTASIPVRVAPDAPGTVTENQTVTYRGTKGEAQEDIFYVANGLEWVTAMNTSNDHGPQASSPTVKVHIPDDKQTTLTVTTCCFGNGGTPTVTGGTLSDTQDVTDESAGKTGYIHTITRAKGVVTIAFSGNTYIHEIKVGAFEDAQEDPPALSIDVAKVTLQMGKTETAVVTATKSNTTAAITATSQDASVVTAAVNGDKVTLTAVGAGETTVEIAVDGATNEEAKKTVAVKVEAAGTTHYIKEGDYNFQGNPGIWTPDNIGDLEGLDTHGAEPQVQGSTGHGLQDPGAGAGTSGTATGTLQLTVSIPEKQKVRLTFEICGYGAGQAVEVTSSNGEEVEHTKLATGHNGGDLRAVLETTGTVTVTFTSTNPEQKGMWIHSMAVAFLKDDSPDPVADRRIHVWDIAGKAETDTSLYTNHITPETWAAWAASLTDTTAINYAKNGEFPGQTVDLDGLVLTAATPSSNQCSVFSTVSGNWGIMTPKTGSLVNTFEDGYVSAGGYLAYGAGGSGRRYITINGVRKGETVVAYVGNNQKETTFGVEGVDGVSVTTASKAYGILSFIAPQSGNYKIYEPANSGKPAYLRVAVIPTVQVSGSITLPADFDAAEGWGLKFTDTETKAVTMGTVDKTAKTYVAELAPDHTYNVALANARGWGMTSATKSVATVKTDITSVKTHDLVVEKKEVYDYSGSIAGFAADYDISDLVITLIPDELNAADGVEAAELTINKTDKTFTVTLQPGVEYTLEMAGADDYAIVTPEKVASESGDLTAQTITVETKALQAVSGKLVTLDVDDQFAPLYADSAYDALTATVSELKFVCVEKNELGQEVETKYVYPATVSGGGYTVSLRPGTYLAKATVNGYSTRTHVVVGDKAASKDLLFVSTATPAAVDYAADLYVDGKGGTDLHFKTVTGAMAYIKRMTRTDTQRVTVHIAPGTYREQISIDSKNVTFVNDTPGKEAKLTWYYGIGYKYYSASGPSNLERWYDAQNAFDRYEKNNGKTEDVARWGCTVRVQAPGFQAENITFENSFNYYLTEEEIADGVEIVPSSITYVREYGADVTSKAATERAAALWVDTNNGRGDMTEFKSCKFLSSQDTFGTGKRMYLKDCYIEGMTDYICGPGDCVFDTCVLNWKGYSEKEAAAYLTAPQTNASEKGYLFRNCYISGDTKLKLVPNHLGRTWGAANTKCIFLNTTLQNDKMLDNTTWIEMQGFNPANSSTLLEWGTTLADGTAVDLSKRTLQNTVAKSEPTAKPEDYFAGWAPEYYVKEADGVAVDGALSVSDNGDINLPHPGHTLTVGYTLTPEANNANDASTIQWYRVKDGAETLVKTSSATAGKTYQIQEADVGAQIKVTVTPKTMSGQTGEPKSFTVAEAVLAGFEDPSGSIDPVLGAGVNVYLAGDSTVKDYSAAGMWNGGKVLEHSSWGEDLQYFFNDKVTVVNYAQGGRTTRSFIEQDGSLEKIDATMKEGDFLFIQFGHNDCYTGDDRGVPLGIAKNSPQKSYAEGGVYPDASLEANAYHPAGSKTYTAYLKDYLAVAKKHNATAVLMTPVARMYYTDGKIRPHHDATAFDGTNDNEYCKAVKWVYDWAMDNGYENNVLFMDNYQLTADLFEKAYADGGNDTYGKQLMGIGEGTHNSKLGGLIEAAVIAQAIQNSDMTIAKAVKAPAQVMKKAHTGETAVVVDGNGALTAYDLLTDYAQHAIYWEGKGQEMFDDIAAKAAELNSGDDPSVPVDKTALNKAVADAKAALAAATVADNGSQVATDKTWITAADKATLEAAIAAAEALGDDATATQVKNALTAVNNAAKAIKAGEKISGGGSGSGSGRPAIGQTTTPGGETSTTTSVTNPDGTVATSTTDKDGNVDITVKGEDGEVLAEVKLPATIADSATKFIDVPDDHWAAKAINDMASLGMVKGVSEDTYDMVSPMTRGAIATIFHRLSNGAEGKTASFADVAADAWYADAIGWAAATGVVNGYSETTFGPDDTITRQQLAVMIARYARLLGLDTQANPVALDAFVDGSTADGWAVDSLAWCVKNGVMKGRGSDVLDPTAAVTRAEAAVMLDRMISLIK